MRHYKANLTIVAGSYGDLERRVLRYLSTTRAVRKSHSLVGSTCYLFIRDGLLVDSGRRDGVVFSGPAGEIWSEVGFEITDLGRQFIAKWIAAGEIS